MAALLFIMTLLSITHASSAACLPGWLGFEESCYLFKDVFVTWPEASSYCRALDAHLAIIDTPEEDAFLRNKALSLNVSVGYWLDGEDIASEGYWTWASTREHITEYLNWAPGEPDDLSDQDCLHLLKPAGYRWDDLACNSKVGFICEYQDSGPVQGVIG